jgi:large subunit ribosomal protein L7A
VTPELSTCRKVAGIKQTMRALREHRAEKLYIARDADPAALGAVEAMAREQGLSIDRESAMAQLGRSAGIAVGAAVVAVLKE